VAMTEHFLRQQDLQDFLLLGLKGNLWAKLRPGHYVSVKDVGICYSIFLFETNMSLNLFCTVEL
jgi:hypothetical protein